MIPRLRNPRLRFVVEPTTEGGGTETPPETAATAAAEDTPAETPPAEEAPADDDPESVDALPDWAQAEIKRLRKENGDRRTKAKELEEKLTGALSAEEAAELRAAHAALERSLIVERVTHKHSLPGELAELLKGDTEEELAAHAATLAALVAKPATSRRTPGGGLEPEAEVDDFDPVAEAQKARARRY